MSTNTLPHAAETIAAQKREIQLLQKMVTELEAEKFKLEDVVKAWRKECIRLISGE